MSWTKQDMADEVIGLLDRGTSLNLGIGLPTLIAGRIPQSKNIIIHSENGVLGVGPSPITKEVSPTLINAGKETITIEKGASFFDSSLSFGMIRGGHIDYCILGGMQVDRHGNLANWMIPGKKITGMGGAMDLVNGAKEVIVMMTHFNKHGQVKLLDNCELPLTGKKVVHKVVTDYGIFEIKNSQFHLLKLAPNKTISDLKIDGLY